MQNDQGKWIWFDSDRSNPRAPWGHINPTGFYLDAEGPMHLKNVQFMDFPPNEFTGEKPCNIRFRNEYRQMMGATSSVEGGFMDSTIPAIWFSILSL